MFSGNEISQICFIFALPFLSKIHRRTLWTSVAMILTAFGLFLCASPFFAKVVFPDLFLVLKTNVEPLEIVIKDNKYPKGMDM